MELTKNQLVATLKGQDSKIELERPQTKIETKQMQPPEVCFSQSKQQILMKLYVYGSCQLDQFKHPNNLSQSKKPICITNIQKFNLQDSEDDQGEQSNKKQKIYPNPLFQKSVVKVACGGLHSVVLTGDGKSYTFGCNDEGALGRKGPQCIPLQVDLDYPVDLISAGDNHSMFANSVNGIIYFTGNYNFLRGQKMVESVTSPIKFTAESIDIRNKNQAIQKIVSGSNHTCILINNKIFCRGQPQSFTTGRRINERRKISNSLTFDRVGLNNVLDVWCGGYHTVAKVKKGKDFLYQAWGANLHGQLGIGNTQPQNFPVQIKSLRGKNVIKVAAGESFTLFLMESGELMGCGTNYYGQLGLGKNYQFVSQSKDQNESQQQLKEHVQNLKIDDGCKVIQPNQINLPATNKEEQTNKVIAQQQKQETAQKKEMVAEEPENKKNVDQLTIFNAEEKAKVKSIRPIKFPQQINPQTKITNIAAGSQFAFAWNNLTELYSWGFGTNFVLLTGEENQQYQAFKVKNKIFNDEIIDQISAGGQHVLYTAFTKTQTKLKPNTTLQKRVTDRLLPQKFKLSRKRKN